MRLTTAFLILLGTAAPALSDTGPVRVIPGKSGVPVIINGRDASYGVVEGDWGLAKSVHVQPTVYGGVTTYVKPEVGHYYPSFGRAPGVGRYEIQPAANRELPQPAESYHRSWGAQSAPPAVPMNSPPVIVAPDVQMNPRGMQQFRN